MLLECISGGATKPGVNVRPVIEKDREKICMEKSMVESNHGRKGSLTIGRLEQVYLELQHLGHILGAHTYIPMDGLNKYGMYRY